MLLRSVNGSNGEDLVEVQCSATARWDEKTVLSALNRLGVKPKWCVCGQAEEPSMFVKLDQMRPIVQLLLGGFFYSSPRSLCSQLPSEGSIRVALRLSVCPHSEEILFGDFPGYWFVKDVVIALSLDSPSLKDSMASYDKSAVQMAETDSGRLLSADARLADLERYRWTAVPTVPESFCILRGFPFGYQLTGVLDFMWYNGVSPTDVAQVCLQRRGTSLRFTGLAFVAFRPGILSTTYKGHLHCQVAGDRYIECLSRDVATADPRHRGLRRTSVPESRDSLLTLSRPLWWDAQWTDQGGHVETCTESTEAPSFPNYRTRSPSPIETYPRTVSVSVPTLLSSNAEACGDMRLPLLIVEAQ